MNIQRNKLVLCIFISIVCLCVLVKQFSLTQNLCNLSVATDVVVTKEVNSTKLQQEKKAALEEASKEKKRADLLASQIDDALTKVNLIGVEMEALRLSTEQTINKTKLSIREAIDENTFKDVTTDERNNNNDDTTNSTASCKNGYRIHGKYPECIPYVDPNNYSAAWHMLAYGGEQYLTEGIQNAEQFVKIIPKYDVIISVDISNQNRLDTIQSKWTAEHPNGPKLHFIILTETEYRVPSNVQPTEKHAPLNYKKMNYFRIRTQFQLDLPQQYTYIIQLDSNLFPTTIPCDPIQVMIKSRSLFGWFNAGVEQRHIMTNFNAQYNHYLTDNQLDSGEFWHLQSTSGGCLIFDTRLFTSASYHDFVDFIDGTGLMFTERLSDQNVFPYAMNLLTYGRHVHRFSGFSFDHTKWGGSSVFSDKLYPIWHQSKSDPFCNDSKPASDLTDNEFDALQEEYFWINQLEIRDKNALLAKSYS